MFTDNVPDDCQIAAFCERLERERNTALIARNAALLRCLLIATAERDALAKERDDANALSLSLCADMDGDVQNRDDEIAVLRADVARLRAALAQCFLHLRHAKDCATSHVIWKPCDCGMPEASKLARAALATSNK